MQERHSYENGSESRSWQRYEWDERNRFKERVINAQAYDSVNNTYYGYEFSHEYYGYDPLSRLSLTDRRLRWSRDGSEERKGDSFAYNDAGELTSAQYGLMPDSNNVFANPDHTREYFPDAAGNRLSVNANGMLLASYTPNSLNQYAETNNGSEHEVSGYQGVTYRYLADTHLAGVSSSSGGTYELGYDALGRCVRRTTNGVASFYYYDGERPILEYDASGAVTKNTYGIGIDEIIARDAGNLWYHQDRLGNISAVTNALGQVVEQYSYDAFGTPEIRSGPLAGNPNGTVLSGTLVSNRFLFTGREWVARYGFYEYRNRAYNPALGRFMSEDPKGFAAGDRNLFRYCGGDPVNRTDPMGLWDINLVPDWDSFRKLMGDIKLIHKDRMTVGAHATSTYIMNSNWNGSRDSRNEVPVSMRLPVDQLVKQIKAMPKYAPTMPVRLEMCNAGDFRGAAEKGQLAVAQQVANGLRTNPVSANTGLVSAFDGSTTGTDVTFYGPDSGHTTVLPNTTKNQSQSGRNSLGDGNAGRPAYGQLSGLVSTGGGGWATAGYFPGGGEEGEGFHPVTPDKN